MVSEFVLIYLLKIPLNECLIVSNKLEKLLTK